jgi:hypothetical protein
MTGDPIKAAKHFHRDAATIRRWIADGCPVLRPGGKGPGKAAVLDFTEVEKWRGQFSSALEPNCSHSAPVEHTLNLVADAFADCLRYDRVEERTGATDAESAKLFLLAFDRISKSLGEKYSLDSLPEGIRALARVLYDASDDASPRTEVEI